MTSASATEPPRSAPSPWFRSAPFDLLLILAVPFATWPLVMAGKLAWGAELLNQLILLTATGHYFATFVRAYGDLDLFARFRVRFVLAPIVLLATCAGMFTTGNGPALMVLVWGWGFWHWLAQAFGFARIYDIKVGSFRPLTAWLDKALVITGFIGAIVLNDGALAEAARTFVGAGITLPSAEQFTIVEHVVLGAMILVGSLYAVNLGWTIARGLPWSWQKQFMHVTTIGYYWFAFAWLPNVLVAYVLYELFHDIQYYAITWLTCRQRIRRPGTAKWLQFLFRPTWGAAIIFVLLMTAFGGVDAIGRGDLASTQLGDQLWLSVFLTFALLHYYYDGFIWKARENTLGSDLGIKGGLGATVVPGLRHAGYWALFFAPMIAILTFGAGHPDRRDSLEALVALAPDDFQNQRELGLALTADKQFPAAFEHYRASIRINPDLALTRLNYGSALDLAGDLDAAAAQYEKALQCPDRAPAHQLAHTNLGVILLVRGDRAAAESHFAAAQKLGGKASDPIHRMMGLAAAAPTAAAERRIKLYAAVLQLDPEQVDANGNLGDLLLARGEAAAAEPHFKALLRVEPQSVPGLLGLARTQATLQQINEARATLRRALRLAPGNPALLALQAQLSGR